jgi:VWFA-related protein
MKALLFLIVVTAAGQTPLAKNSPPAGQEPGLPYRTGTRVVEISVNATHAGQKPVNDLQATDLRLFDNGKEQTIASFEKPGPGGGVLRGTTVPAGRHPQRLSIIVLDALNTSWSDEIYAREGVSRMLGKLAPGDRIAIFALDSNLHLLHDFSNDYESLRTAVDNYAGAQPPDLVGWEPYPARVATTFDVSTYPFHTTYPYDQPYPFDSSSPNDPKYAMDRQVPFDLYNALAFDTVNGVSSPEAFAVQAAAPLDAHTTAGAFNVSVAGAFADFEETNQILDTFQSLVRIAQLTRSYPGPKSILWVSSGFPTQFETYITGVGVPEFFHLQAARAMRELEIDNAALYPVSPEGLNGAHIQSMKELADEADGRAFYDSNDVAGLVRAARDDSNEGYILSFVPKDYQADGSLHRIRIETSRPGVDLRYRGVYIADVVSPAVRGVTFSTPGSPMITSVANTGNRSAVAPNSWVVINGSNLAPAGDSRTWRLSDVVKNQLPTELDGVAVTMNGERAYVYSISPGQVKALTPPDLAPGPVRVNIIRDGVPSASFTVKAD